MRIRIQVLVFPLKRWAVQLHSTDYVCRYHSFPNRSKIEGMCSMLSLTKQRNRWRPFTRSCNWIIFLEFRSSLNQTVKKKWIPPIQTGLTRLPGHINQMVKKIQPLQNLTTLNIGQLYSTAKLHFWRSWGGHTSNRVQVRCVHKQILLSTQENCTICQNLLLYKDFVTRNYKMWSHLSFGWIWSCSTGLAQFPESIILEASMCPQRQQFLQ